MIETRIASLRKEKQMSQERLAELLNTSRQAVSKWERGESYPDIDRLKELAALFGVSIDYLLGYDIESISAKNFLARLSECVQTKDVSIDVKELKLVLSTHPNHFELLLKAVEYLLLLISSNHDVSLAELVIDYCQKAILIFPSNYKGECSIQDLQEMVITCYSLQNRFDLIKEYIQENDIKGVETSLAEAELELGDYEKAITIGSNSFLQSISSMLNGNLTQIRALLKTEMVDEAYELSSWCNDFVKSIKKKDDLFFQITFVLAFIQACCQRFLGLDDSEAVRFLQENKEKQLVLEDTTEDIKFYYDKKVLVLYGLLDTKQWLEKEFFVFFKGSKVAPIGQTLFLEIYGGPNNG